MSIGRRLLLFDAAEADLAFKLALLFFEFSARLFEKLLLLLFGAPSPDLERQLAVALPEDLLLLLLLLFLLNLNRDGSFGDSGDLGADVEAVEEDVLSWLPEPSEEEEEVVEEVVVEEEVVVAVVEEVEAAAAVPSIEVLKLVGGVGDEADLKRPPIDEAEDLRLEEALLLAELVLKRRIIIGRTIPGPGAVVQARSAEKCVIKRVHKEVVS
ncbi:hypothetical protein TYRP_018490 [Tyrophagus putrescentiae]|nr:hypothetical protein TYRP_018490 [Tyrophagus putrescentiae]